MITFHFVISARIENLHKDRTEDSFVVPPCRLMLTYG